MRKFNSLVSVKIARASACVEEVATAVCLTLRLWNVPVGLCQCWPVMTVLAVAKARGMACVQEIIIVLGSQRGDERASQELMC